MAAPGGTGQLQPISPAAEQLREALKGHMKERYQIQQNVMHPSWDDEIPDAIVPFLTDCTHSFHAGCCLVSSWLGALSYDALVE